ncbi:MAG: DUF1611 domain-containing protein [Desertifilum sp.]|nr:DUF1611 domain-containing protein [Desertifilum sp.]
MSLEAQRAKLQNGKIAILLHDGMQRRQGKTGLALLRYSPAEIVAVIDREFAGESVTKLTRIPREVPIVASVAEVLSYQPDAIAIGIAPSGGALPDEWIAELKQAVAAGISVVNGLHTPLGTHPELQPLLQGEQFIWDIRQEPPGLGIASAKARQLSCLRVLTVGTDMSIGKMSTSLELHRTSLKRGLKSCFVGTGQAGIMISGAGIPLDAVRVDFAAGAVEQQVLKYGAESDILHIEGQGSLMHPGSTATLPLIRGSQPTHLILGHRWGQTQIHNCPDVEIPPLPQAIELYEKVASIAGATHPIRVAGVALNTAKIDNDEQAREAIAQTQAETGLPCTDAVRFGGDVLLDALL